MQQSYRSRHPRLAAATEVAADVVVLLGAVALFAWFALTLPSSEDPGTATAGRATPEPIVAPPSASAGRDSPIIYVYGPPDVAAALRADLAAAITAAALEGAATPEVIVDGLDSGQRKVFFIDLR